MFIARRDKPSVVWSDHGTSFIGAARELEDNHKFQWNHQVELYAEHATTFWRAVVSCSQKLQASSQTCHWRCTSHVRGTDYHARGTDYHARSNSGMLKFEADECYVGFRQRN